MSVILGIKNRTENWKTAKHFARYFTNDEAVAKLAQRLGEPETTSGKCMQIELFWKGMRDHVKREQCKTGEWKSDELVEELENCIRSISIVCGLMWKNLELCNFRTRRTTDPLKTPKGSLTISAIPK